MNEVEPGDVEPGVRSSRSAAAARLLSSTDSTDYDEDDWIETKEALERELVAKGP